MILYNKEISEVCPRSCILWVASCARRCSAFTSKTSNSRVIFSNLGSRPDKFFCLILSSFFARLYFQAITIYSTQMFFFHFCLHFIFWKWLMHVLSAGKQKMNKNSLGWSSLLMQFSPINFIWFGTQKLHCLKIYLTAIQRKTWTNLQFQI